MDKDAFINELKEKLNKLNNEELKEEIDKIESFIENGKSKNINEEDIIRSFGSTEDLVKTIYLKRGIKQSLDKKSPTNSGLVIFSNIKKAFLSKDKKIIFKTIGRLLYILLLAIIVKIPFIFVRTILLEYLNTNNVSYSIQNILEGCFEVIYYIVALMVIYKYLKKYFIKE